MLEAKPIIRQYFTIKNKYPDSILLFRLGDFYEIFGGDAKIAAPIMNVVLTSRHDTPMCGVPAHSVMGYILRLLKAGYKVAVAEQVELTKKMYEREVVRVYTPSTLIEDELIDELGDIELLSIIKKEDFFEVAKFNVSKNAVKCIKTNNDLWLEREIKSSIEVVTNRYTYSILQEKLNGKTIYFFNGETALDIGFEYIKSIIPSFRLERIYELDLTRYMVLDENTLDGLEIVDSPSGKGNSLFDVLNETATKGGSIYLKNALKMPLLEKEDILKRQRFVEFFYENYELSKQIHKLLKKLVSGDRITTRIICMTAQPTDLIGLKNSLKVIIEIKNIFSIQNLLYDEPIKEIISKLNVEDIYYILDNALNEELTTNNFEERIFKEGYSKELDEVYKFSKAGRSFLLQLEEEEKQKLSIPLKIGFNSIYGFYIEITKSNIDKVPPSYKRIQTLVNAERFVNDRLLEIGNKILLAEENIKNIQRDLFKKLLVELKNFSNRLYQIFDVIYELDFYVTLGKLAYERGYTKPEIIESGSIEIINGRHPVLDVKLGRSFVPNSFIMDGKGTKVYIITGPNMAGKSTFLRQCATIIILAQVGSFIPADSARITPCDRILTRIKTIDYIAKGESTFMVEMKEVANIIKNLTPRSLVILDEVGRGTSTYDGIAIAMSLIEYFVKLDFVKVLFATHFIELAGLADVYKQVKNLTVEVREIIRKNKSEIVFLHKVVEGVTDKSYG
ncbi:MAG: DNA mismatch repair protein MutS, partial [bacterium]|nr:DNA mismatch repair protein MutS [bacterium]